MGVSHKTSKSPRTPQKLIEDGFLFGIRLDRFGYKDQLLIAVTEKRTKEEMDQLVERLRYNISHEGTSSSTSG